MNLSGLKLLDGVYKAPHEMIDDRFEKLYLSVRQKEGRVYSINELQHLPDLNKSHPLFKEWNLRKNSAGRLVRWLQLKKTPIKILEIGCGNGWLSNLLADIAGADVYALDINFMELKQAASVFKRDNLTFFYGNFSKDFLREIKFDTIIFAASLQYFPSVKNILSTCLKKLNIDGEIHILDTSFYKQPEIEKAKKRTQNYYTTLGCHELANYYHHHAMKDLDDFEYSKLYNPDSFTNKFLSNKSPFPWICIKATKFPANV